MGGAQLVKVVGGALSAVPAPGALSESFYREVHSGPGRVTTGSGGSWFVLATIPMVRGRVAVLTELEYLAFAPSKHGHGHLEEVPRGMLSGIMEFSIDVGGTSAKSHTVWPPRIYSDTSAQNDGNWPLVSSRLAPQDGLAQAWIIKGSPATIRARYTQSSATRILIFKVGVRYTLLTLPESHYNELIEAAAAGGASEGLPGSRPPVASFSSEASNDRRSQDPRTEGGGVHPVAGQHAPPLPERALRGQVAGSGADPCVRAVQDEGRDLGTAHVLSSLREGGEAPRPEGDVLEDIIRRRG